MYDFDVSMRLNRQSNECFGFISGRVAWRLHCQGDTDSYTADCRLGPDEQEQKERKPQPPGDPAKPQKQHEQQPPPPPPIPHYYQWQHGLFGRLPSAPLAQLLPTGWLVLFK